MTALAVTAGRYNALRRLAGIAVSVVFAILTLARVDLGEAAAALGRVAPLGLLAAIGLTSIEVALRAERWRRILLPIAPVDYRSAFTYLCIGYFANTLLPARLGDLARAVLAARAFGIPRMRTLGTILLERVADGLLILSVVSLLTLLLPEAQPLVAGARVLALVGAIGLAGLLTVVLVTHRTRMAATRIGILVRDVLARLAGGLHGVRTPARLAAVLALTIIPFAVAVLTLLSVAGALGISLTVAQAVLVMGALALSTAIPAAPGSLGTYEFVGVATMAGLGIAPAEALALVVLVHVVATLPPALFGLVATSVLHLNILGSDRSLVQEPAHT
jgi:uncharacterized protein (TIRG00374 family)